MVLPDRVNPGRGRETAPFFLFEEKEIFMMGKDGKKPSGLKLMTDFSNFPFGRKGGKKVTKK